MGGRREQRGRAKLEWLVVLMHITDTANEQKFGLVELLESLSGDGTRAGTCKALWTGLSWF